MKSSDSSWYCDIKDSEGQIVFSLVLPVKGEGLKGPVESGESTNIYRNAARGLPLRPGGYWGLRGFICRGRGGATLATGLPSW